MPRLSELLSINPPLTNNVSRYLLQQWISKADQGFQEGEEVDITIIKDIIQGSKGDCILVVPRRWFIVTNLSFERLLTAVRPHLPKMHSTYTFHFKVRVIKDVPERKYTLCKLIEGKIEGQYTDNDTKTEILERLDDVEIDGVKFTKTKVLKKTFQITKRMTITIADDIKTSTDVISRKEVDSKKQETLEYKIVNKNTRLASLISRMDLLCKNRDNYSGHLDFYMLYDNYLVMGYAYYTPTLSIHKIALPSEDILKELSKYYVITIPKCYIEDTIRQSIYTDLSTIRRTLYEVDVYYDGEKKTITLKGLSEIPTPLRLGIRRRRYGITQYARKTLPYGKIWSLEKDKTRLTNAFSEFTNEALHLYDIIKDRLLTTDKVSPREVFEDIFFIRSPKRKLKHLDTYLQIYNEVKDYAEKATLYLVFYGQTNEFRRFLPNYKAFRFQDGRITVDNAPPVPVSAITLKGGEFEKRYREVYNLDNIILYHYATTEEKLAIIQEEIKEIRKMLNENGIDPKKIAFKDLLQVLKELSLMEEYPKNIILSFIRYATSDMISDGWTADWKVEVRSALEIIAGLVRSGRPEDYTEKRLSRLLRVLRVATLYIMKERGYSPMLGVVFSGSPEDILMKILEFIRRLKGRQLALMMKLREEEKKETIEKLVEKRPPLLTLSERVKALMNTI